MSEHVMGITRHDKTLFLKWVDNLATKSSPSRTTQCGNYPCSLLLIFLDVLLQDISYQNNRQIYLFTDRLPCLGEDVRVQILDVCFCVGVGRGFEVNTFGMSGYKSDFNYEK